MYIKSRLLAQKENKRKFSRKEQVAKTSNSIMVNIGDTAKCPECATMGSVVWVSQDKKTMGVQCRRSHGETSRSESKFGATVVPSTKTRKNVVFITAVR
jgi:hypothetical protein